MVGQIDALGRGKWSQCLLQSLEVFFFPGEGGLRGCLLFRGAGDGEKGPAAGTAPRRPKTPGSPGPPGPTAVSGRRTSLTVVEPMSRPRRRAGPGGRAGAGTGTGAGTVVMSSPLQDVRHRNQAADRDSTALKYCSPPPGPRRDLFVAITLVARTPARCERNIYSTALNIEPLYFRNMRAPDDLPSRT